MVSLVYRKKNTRFWWIVGEKDPLTGKRKDYSSKTTIRELAEIKASNDRGAAFKRREFGMVVAVDWTVKKLIDEMWDAVWSEVDGADKDVILLALKAPLDKWGDRSASALTRTEIRAFRKERQKSVKFSSVNREFSRMAAAYSWAVDEGHLTQNPFKFKKALKNEARLRRDRSATPLERDKIEKDLTGWIRKIVLFALSNGMRQGEIRGLRWADVNRDQGVIKVESRKGGEVIRRYVPIFSTTAEILDSLPAGEFVFPDPDGAMIKKDTLVHAFIRAVRGLGIENLTFHDLRHTFATEYFRRTEDIVRLSGVLGHRKLETTMRYVNLRLEDLVRAKSADFTTEKIIETPKTREIVDNQR